MPSGTTDEIERTVEQGQKVKAIGWELGLLEKEVDPDYPRRELEEKMFNYKAVFGEAPKMLRNHPQKESLLKLNEYKKERLAQIEKDYQEKNKSIPQLWQELDELVRMREIPINEPALHQI